mgnify:FL=1
MKVKVVLALFLIVVLIFLIYTFNIKNDIFYFNVMDKKYDYDTYNVLLNENLDNVQKYISYEQDDYRATDLIRDINDNIIVNNRKIQNILIKADIITLMIGNNELNYKIKNIDMTELFEYSNSLLEDLDDLFKLVRKYSKEKIFFIGFYNSNEYYEELYRYLNLRIKDMCDSYNIVYIDRLMDFSSEENVNIYKKIIKKY